MSYHTDHARELSLDRGEAKYWTTDMDANDPGYTFKNVDQAADFANASGFLDKFLNKKTNLQEQKEKETKSEDTRETARELGKAWQSGSLGENLNFLAQSGGNEQPMVIGGGPAQPGAGSRAVSGAMTGAQLGSFIPGVGTGVGAAIGAGAGLLGII